MEVGKFAWAEEGAGADVLGVEGGGEGVGERWPKLWGEVEGEG